MADLSVMGFLNEETQQETEYNIKDAQARSDINAINGKIPSGASTSNQLVTRILLENSLTDKVDKTSIGANNGVAGLDNTGRVPSSQLPSYVDDVLEYASISAFPATGESGKIYIAQDTNLQYRWSGTQYAEISESLALGETSSTAYAGNKGKANADAITAMKDGTNIDSFGDVETALDGKVDKVTGKGLSTNDYDNTAKGIVDNIQSNVIANTKLIKDTVGWSGKNLAHNYKPSATIDTVSFTVNADGSIKLNTSSATTQTVEFTFDQGEISKMLKVSDLNGRDVILSGSDSAEEEYGIEAIYRTSENAYISDQRAWNGDLKLTIPSNAYYIRICVIVKPNKTVSNKTVYPMLRYADILDPTYEPYFGSTAFPRSEQAVLGAVNLLQITDGTTEASNITCVRDRSANTVTFSGTASATQDFLLASNYPVKKGTYYCSGLTDGSGFNTYWLRFRDHNNTSNNVIVDTEEKAITFNSDTTIDVQLFVNNGTAISSPKVAYVMMALAPNQPFAPHAMTNKELTDAVAYSTGADIDLSHSESTTTSSLNTTRSHVEKVGKLCILDVWINTVSIADLNAFKEIGRVAIKPTKETPVSFVTVAGKSYTGVIDTAGIIKIFTSSALSNDNITGQAIYYTND